MINSLLWLSKISKTEKKNSQARNRKQKKVRKTSSRTSRRVSMDTATLQEAIRSRNVAVLEWYVTHDWGVHGALCSELDALARYTYYGLRSRTPAAFSLSNNNNNDRYVSLREDAATMLKATSSLDHSVGPRVQAAAAVTVRPLSRAAAATSSSMATTNHHNDAAGLSPAAGHHHHQMPLDESRVRATTTAANTTSTSISRSPQQRTARGGEVQEEQSYILKRNKNRRLFRSYTPGWDAPVTSPSEPSCGYYIPYGTATHIAPAKTTPCSTPFEHHSHLPHDENTSISRQESSPGRSQQHGIDHTPSYSSSSSPTARQHRFGQPPRPYSPKSNTSLVLLDALSTVLEPPGSPHSRWIVALRQTAHLEAVHRQVRLEREAFERSTAAAEMAQAYLAVRTHRQKAQRERLEWAEGRQRAAIEEAHCSILEEVCAVFRVWFQRYAKPQNDVLVAERISRSTLEGEEDEARRILCRFSFVGSLDDAVEARRLRWLQKEHATSVAMRDHLQTALLLQGVLPVDGSGDEALPSTSHLVHNPAQHRLSALALISSAGTPLPSSFSVSPSRAVPFPPVLPDERKNNDDDESLPIDLHRPSSPTSSSVKFVWAVASGSPPSSTLASYLAHCDTTDSEVWLKAPPHVATPLREQRSRPSSHHHRGAAASSTKSMRTSLGTPRQQNNNVDRLTTPQCQHM